MDYFFTGCMIFVVCCWIQDIYGKKKKSNAIKNNLILKADK